MPTGIYPRKSIEERFWAKVKKTKSCWMWLGLIGKNGYGNLWLNKRYQSPHRVAYLLGKGEISEGLTIDHLCRNRACVNPDHLEVVTSRTNTLRGNNRAAINARKTHCIKGHPLTKDNLVPNHLERGERSCLTCHREYNRSHFGKKYLQEWKAKRKIIQGMIALEEIRRTF